MRQQTKIYQLTAYLLSILFLVLIIGTPIQLGATCQCTDLVASHCNNFKKISSSSSKKNKRSCCSTKYQQQNKKQLHLVHSATGCKIEAEQIVTLQKKCCCSNEIKQFPATIAVDSTYAVDGQTVDYFPLLLVGTGTDMTSDYVHFAINLLSNEHGLSYPPLLLTKQIILLIQSFLL